VVESDAVLVQRCLDGDNLAFDTLVRRYQRQVLGLCRRMLGPGDDATDAAQEAFLKVYHALPAFRQDCAFLPWLLTVVSNTCLDAGRRRSRKPVESLDDLPPSRQPEAGDEFSPEASAISADRYEALRAAVAKVPETNRVVLELFYFGGLDLVAISRMLGRPEGTVKSQLHRAREILRRKLEGRV